MDTEQEQDTEKEKEKEKQNGTVVAGAASAESKTAGHKKALSVQWKAQHALVVVFFLLIL